MSWPPAPGTLAKAKIRHETIFQLPDEDASAPLEGDQQIE